MPLIGRGETIFWANHKVFPGVTSGNGNCLGRLEGAISRLQEAPRLKIAAAASSPTKQTGSCRAFNVFPPVGPTYHWDRRSISTTVGVADGCSAGARIRLRYTARQLQNAPLTRGFIAADGAPPNYGLDLRKLEPPGARTPGRVYDRRRISRGRQ